MQLSVAFVSLLTIASASVQLGRRDCSHDNCLRALIRSSADASSFCATYTDVTLEATATLPAYATQCSNEPSRLSSACSCLNTAPIITSTTFIASPTSTSIQLSSSSSSTFSTPTSTPSPTTSSSSVTTTSTGNSCTCTEYSQIAPAVASCNVITLQDISVPTNSSINLASLKANSIVTFAGLTTFAFTNSSTFNPITFGGKNVTITSAPGAIIDGNGQAYWDGQGSNGGVPK